MRHTYLVLLLLLGWTTAQSQSYGYLTPTWIRNYPQSVGGVYDKDGRPIHIARHPGGGYLTVANGTGLTVTRLDAQGTVLWSKYPRLRPNMYIYADSKMSSDAQANILISSGTSLVKLNANGDTVWTRTFPNMLRSRFSTQMVVAPDGNYVVVHEETWGTNPGFIDLYALKLNAATGQIIWNTSLNATVAGRTIGSYGLMPGLERRASGYFVFIWDAMILLEENGTNPRLRSSRFYPWSQTMYSSATQTTLISNPELSKLNDQGEVVAVQTGRPPLGVSSGSTGWMAEDSQNSIITVNTTDHVGGPSSSSWKEINIQRLSRNLVLLDMQRIDTKVVDKFNLVIAPTGEYIAAGQAFINGKVDGLVVLSIPAYSVLATAKPASVVGSLALYPNPVATGNITIALPSAIGAGEVSVYDLLGRVQGVPQAVAGVSATVALPPLAAGVYVVRLTSPDGRAWTNRLTVQ